MLDESLGRRLLIDDYRGFYEKASAISQQTDCQETASFADLLPRADATRLKILDLGCAEGELAAILASREHDVTEADISQHFLDMARRTFERNGVSVRLANCDIESGEGIDPTWGFDVVYFMDLTEHLCNSTAALANTRAILADDGVLIINTPNSVTLGEPNRYIWKRKQLEDYFRPENLWDLHLNAYDYIALERTLNFVGFRVVEVILTILTLPPLRRVRCLTPVFKQLERFFPLLSDNLLVRCVKVEPIDVEIQLDR